MLSILWLFVYDYKTVCDHAWIPILFFFFFFERLNSRFRTWITAEWPDTWPMWVTLMDWSLRDSWSRNYRISLRFSNHFCWNWIEIVHIFCGIWIDCLSTLFFFFFLGGGEGVLWYCLNLEKWWWMIVDRIEFYMERRRRIVLNIFV